MPTQILVIDDDAIVVSVIRQILEGAGFAVSTAPDGQAGLAAFRRSRPDLVITDIIMPEKEGIQAITELRGMWPEGKIIAVSGGGRVGNADFLQIARRVGADAVLAKPFELEELIATVRRCLESPRATAQSSVP